MEKMNILPNSLEISEEEKKRSLELFAQSLRLFPDARFPSERLVQTADLEVDGSGRLVIPMGPWETDRPRPQVADLTNPNPDAKDYYTDIDQSGRPVHPWYREMLSDPTVGIIAGKGTSYYYGPNFTADPIIMRYDHGEPEILLIVRAKSGAVALPGGFVDQGETPDVAAIRECYEETGIELQNDQITLSQIYHGPVFDARATINAWPVTTAYRIDVSNELASRLPSGEFDPCNDEVEKAMWIPISRIPKGLFGSHELLIERALEQQDNSKCYE